MNADGNKMIYVASSWRNEQQPMIVAVLRAANFEVYDFKNPGKDDHGFHWSSIEGGWQTWDGKQFIAALDHPIAKDGFAKDMRALDRADICVLLLPCGRSAHLEAGYAAGRGKKLIIVLDETGKLEPELMYKMADHVVVGAMDLLAALGVKDA